MRLIYIANARMPTEKAHGVQIAKMCESFGNSGFEVTLIVPNRNNIHTQSVHDFYGTEKNFAVKYLPIVGFLGFRFIQITFMLSLRKFFHSISNEDLAVFTRDVLAARVLSKKYHVFYEMHDFPESWHAFWRHVLIGIKGLVVTNEWKRDEVNSKFGVSKEKILVAPNGFDPDIFGATVENRNVVRKEIGLPEGAFVMCYQGMLTTLGKDKGINYTFDVLKKLPDQIRFLLVGGSPVEIEEYKNIARRKGVFDRTVFVDRVSHNCLNKYLVASDVLIAPFPDTIHYRLYMSPIKIFEYMASGRPIIATNLPSIREIVGTDMATLITPDDTQSFVKAVLSVREKYENALEKAERAKEYVQKFTWKKRSDCIKTLLKILKHGFYLNFMIDALGIQVLKVRKKHVLPELNGKLLDVGCGTNEIVRDYKNRTNNDATGVDVYPWEGVDVLVEDTAEMPFEEKTFDTVSCIAAINHIPNREEVIREMRRVLKDDGRIVVTMITPRFSRFWHFVRSPWDADQHERGMKEGEVFGFTKKQMKDLFASAGMELSHMKYFLFGLNRVYVFEKNL